MVKKELLAVAKEVLVLTAANDTVAIEVVSILVVTALGIEKLMEVVLIPGSVVDVVGDVETLVVVETETEASVVSSVVALMVVMLSNTWPDFTAMGLKTGSLVVKLVRAFSVDSPT